jgi:hypothetical protein
MGTVIFAVTFSGGNGTLNIQIDKTTNLSFVKDECQKVLLSKGAHIYIASGAASPGPHGGIRLDITGDVIADSPKKYGPGLLLPDANDIDVNP